MGSVLPPTDRGDPIAGSRNRHKEKVLDALKKGLSDVIADQPIITGSRDQKVRVPVKTIKEFGFIFGPNNPGTAQGDAGEGQTVGQVPGRGSSDGKGSGKQAGNEPGEDWIEVEVTIGDLEDLLFSHLKLPDMVKKQLQEEASEGWELKSFQRTGPQRRLAKRPTLKRHRATKAGLKAAIDYARKKLNNLEEKNNPTPVEKVEIERLRKFLEQQELLQQKLRDKAGEMGSRRDFLLPIKDDDMRYWKSEPREEKQTNAVVFLMLDTSASMGELEKFLARTYFWLWWKFLKSRYSSSKVVFLVHHTEAKEVGTEEEFFKRGESGGTKISSVYNLALEIIKDRFAAGWNIYGVHCSDGDNWGDDNNIVAECVRKFCGLAQRFVFAQISPNNKHFVSEMLRKLNEIGHDIPNMRTVVLADDGDVYPQFEKSLEESKR